MFNKLKQFKDLRSRAKELQQSLSSVTVEGTANWGKIKIVMDGNQKIQTVSIDPSMLSDQSSVERGVRDAVNDAVTKVQRLLATKMKDFGGSDLAKDMQDFMGKK